MKYGYARTSTKKQKLESQLDVLMENGITKECIFTDQSSGTTKDNRSGYEELLNTVENGDVVVFYTVDRMSRNASEGFEDYMNLINKGVELEFIENPSMNSENYGSQLKTINTVTVDDKLMNETLMNGIREYLTGLLKNQIKAEFKKGEDEAKKIRLKVKQGIKKAVKEGTIGRTKGCSNEHKKTTVPTSFITNYKSGITSASKLAKLHDVSRQTVYSWIKKMD